MKCLWCDQDIASEMSWINFLMPAKSEQLCVKCEGKLELLTGNRCNVCSRMTIEETCLDCQKWSADSFWKDLLIFNHSVFTYNDMMQEVIAKWKYRGDYVLGKVFKDKFKTVFEERFSSFKRDALLVPIPLSEERLSERGFNQAKVLTDFLPLESQEIITRIHSEKQAKKTRHQRISTKNPFIITKKINKPVILVDDIYTTGATLRHAGKLLKENGCPEVYAFTLIRG